MSHQKPYGGETIRRGDLGGRRAVVRDDPVRLQQVHRPRFIHATCLQLIFERVHLFLAFSLPPSAFHRINPRLYAASSNAVSAGFNFL